MIEYVTFHKILDLLEGYQKASPILNSFGFGNLVDFGKSFTGTTQTPQYPYMFVVPNSIQYNENTTVYEVTILFADILNTDVDNEKDAVSDMSLQARRFVSFIRRGYLKEYMDIQMPAQALPFMERFNDHTAGVALTANIVVFEDINACDYYTEDGITYYLLYEDGNVMTAQNNNNIEYEH
jgi:hypothetical protein